MADVAARSMRLAAVRSSKREVRHRRAEILRLLKPLWRTCAWSWPPFHDYMLVYNGVDLCRHCYRPVSLLSLSRSQRVERLEVALKAADDNGLIPHEKRGLVR